VFNFEKIRKLRNWQRFGDLYLDLGNELAKTRRCKVSNFTAKRHALRMI